MGGVSRSPIVRLAGVRLLSGLGTLIAISFFIYGAIELLPGDLAHEVLQSQATDAAVAAFRAQLGLDRPFLVRYIAWLGAALHGDFGQSLVSGMRVSTLLDQRAWSSVMLAVFAAIIAVPLSLLLGVISAICRNSPFDRLAGGATLLCVSFPNSRWAMC